MTGALALIGLPELTAALLVASLNAYVLMGGADFGGGVWDLLATGSRRDAQRTLIADAIGPIWEANHVWLILVVVLCFTAFPAAFAAVFTVLHIPLTVLLIGVVLRGSGFVFRAYGGRSSAASGRWGRMFAVASVITPILLGVVIGALFSGAAGRAAKRTGAAAFVDVFVAPWLAPFPAAVGALTLSAVALLAATYLTVAAADAELRDDFRVRALAAAGAVFVTGSTALMLAPERAPMMHAGLLSGGWSWSVQIGGGLSAAVAVWALWRRKFSLARVAAGAEVSLILWGWALAQYPYLVPTTITIRDGAAGVGTLRALFWALAGGAVILIPSLAYLFRTFARRN